MKKNNWILVPAILLALSPDLLSGGMTLQEVVSTVVQNHPAIHTARYDAEAARQEKKMESWLMDPMVGVQFEEVPLNSSSPGNADMTSYFVSQKIPFPSKLITKNKAKEAEYQAKKVMITAAEREKIFEAKKTFFEIIANQNRLKDQQTILNAYKQIIGSLEKTYETMTPPKSPSPEMGTGREMPLSMSSPFSDVLMARMKKAESEAVLLDLKHQKEAYEAKLNILMGREPHAPLQLVSPKIKKLSADMKTLEEKTLRQNSDLTSMQWMVKAAKKETSLAYQSLIPDFEPEFMYQRRQNMDNAYTLGVSLNFPLWINTKQAQIKKSKAEQKKMESELENETRKMKTELHYLIHHAEEHYKIVSKYKNEIVPLARSSFNAARTAYEAGQIASTNLLNSLISFHQASQMYWEMWEDYQMEYAMLEQIVGEEL